MATHADLQTELQRLNEPGSISRDAADSFLQRHPLSDIFSALDSGTAQPAQVVVALNKVFESGSTPEELVDYALLALNAPAPELRQLAASQLGRTVQGELQEGRPTAQSTAVTHRLLQCLADPDTGVAAAARQALEAIASSAQGLEHMLGEGGQQLPQLIASPDLTVRLRALSLAVSLAATSPEAAAAIRQKGLLEPLAAEAGNADDLLGCAAALQLIVQLAQQSGPAADALLGGSLLPNLRKLVSCGDAFLKGQAVQALGALLAATVATGAGDLQVQHPGSSHTLCTYMLGLLAQVLSAESEEEAEVQTAALDAISQISVSKRGAELLALRGSIPGHVASRALTVRGESSGQIAALHAMASLLGVTRAEEERSSSSALLSKSAESRLQDAVYLGAGSKSPADILLAQVRQPFDELRQAAVRLTVGLGFREWGAREVCSNSNLVQILASQMRGSPWDAHNWRFAFIQGVQRPVETATMSM